MKTSVTTYSFAQYIRAGKLTQIDCVNKAKEIGFDGIEFTTLSPKENATHEDRIAYAKEIRKRADEVGIEIVSYTIGASLYQPDKAARDAEVERLCRELDVAAVLGAKVMRHDVCYSEKTAIGTVGFMRMVPEIAAAAREVTEYARKLGIKTCTENHGFIAQDSYRIEALFNEVGSDNYGVLVDVGNFSCADEDSITAVSRLAPYAVHVHAKDFKKIPYGTDTEENGLVTRACNKIIPTAIGDGDIPVKQCIAILKRAGYDGYLSVEFEGAEDCITAIARGKARLDEYIKEAEAYKVK